MPLQTFEQALGKVADGKTPHVLLGNGFSRACRDDIFAYAALFDRADFAALSPQARQAFDALNTRDFEIVMRALRAAAALIRVYKQEEPELAVRLEADADGLREVLVRAIAQNHPERPGDIPDEQYQACRAFLSHFARIYTVNYDLLLYWAIMKQELPPPEIPSDDGFRKPEDLEEAYVVWEPDVHQQCVYFLHGALHVFDAGTEVQKYTWINTGVPLIDQIRSALESGLYPIFVAEGASNHKLERIRHSDFLYRSLRSFREIGGTLFVYGHSMAASDDHILRMITRGKLKQLFVGIYGDQNSEDNQRIMNKASSVANGRPLRRPLVVDFYDAATAHAWG